MYYPFFLAYMIAGFAISLGVFLWALGRGQFREQARARFLPLAGSPPGEPAKLSRAGRWQAAVLLAMAASGLAATAAAVVVSLVNAPAR